MNHLWTALLLGAAFNSAAAADWKVVATSRPPGHVIEIDRASVSKTANGFLVWERHTFSKPQSLQSTPSGAYSVMLARTEMSCLRRTADMRSMAFYTSAGDALPIKTMEFSEDDPRSVIPDTLGEGVLDAVCAPPRVRPKLRPSDQGGSPSALREYLDSIKPTK